MVITGTSKGLGRYLAEYYVEKGFQIVGCSRGVIDLELDSYQHFCLDVCDESSVNMMFKQIRKEYGRLDVLINNAGIASKNYVLLTSLKEVQDLLNTNFVGTFLFSRESVKLMKINNYGRIIHLSSIHVPLAMEGTSVYGATKASIEQFSKVLAREVFQFGINVNILSLSVVKNTGMENTLTEQIKNKILCQTISKSQLSIHDVTHAINYLINEKSKMVTNQLLSLG
jgi:3-oxoacyl-[acyl-carrier protein] reductase